MALLFVSASAVAARTRSYAHSLENLDTWRALAARPQSAPTARTEVVKFLVDLPPLANFPEIEEMARYASEMLSDALDHFVRGDSNAAREVLARDDKVDALHNSMFRILLTHMMEEPRNISQAMNLFMVSSNLERIADLATNIAEDVVYLVEGRMI